MRIKVLLALAGLALALLFAAGCSDSGNSTSIQGFGTITGTVQDSALDCAPVIGATVQLFQGENFIDETFTDDTGTFTFEDVPFGAYTLVVSGEGFESSTPVTVSTEEPVIVPITISTQPGEGVTVSGAVTGDLITGDTVTLTLIPDGAATGEVVISTVVEVDGAPTAPFTFSNVAANSYTIEVTNTTFAPTFFGPFQVATSAISGLAIPVVSETFLSDAGVPAPAPGTATVVILPPIDQPSATVTFTVDAAASTVSTGGFSYIPDITAATEPVVATVTLDGNTFDVPFIPISDRIIVIQLAPLM